MWQWDGQGSKHVAYDRAIEATRDQSRSETERIAAAFRVIHRVRDGIYELRTQRDDLTNPEGFREACGKWVNRASKMPTEPIPDQWKKARGGG